MAHPTSKNMTRYSSKLPCLSRQLLTKPKHKTQDVLEPIAREPEGCPSLECQNLTGQHLEQHNVTLIRSPLRRSVDQNIFLSLHSTVLNPHCRATHSNFSTMFKLIKIWSCSTYFIQFWTTKQMWTGKYSRHYSKTRNHNYKFF